MVRVSVNYVLFKEDFGGKLGVFVVCSVFRFLRELCWLWEERLLLLHGILQSHQSEAEHAAQEAETPEVLPGPQCARGSDQRTPHLLERLR